MSRRTSRRNFIKLAGAASGLVAGVAPIVLEARAQQQALQEPQRPVSANDKIQIATIGIGGQGSGDTVNALKVPGVELVAVADVYDGRLERAKEVWGNQIFTTRDYREILARPDVDAVIIGTPDHWHAVMSVDAMNAGKDVYCEKPMVHAISEGKRVVDAQNKTNRIFQVGSQRVSSIIYQKAKDLIASGEIGQLNMIEAYWNRNSALGAWQYSLPPDASPQNVDWDRFLGKAPKRPFEPIRLFRWRNYQDYGTGVAGDLFVHLFSGIHFVINSMGPTRVMSTGGLRFWNDGRDVPDVMMALYDYPKTPAHPAFNLSLKVNFADGSGGEEGFRFVGSEGILTIAGTGVTVIRRPRSKEPGYTISTFPKTVQDEFLKKYRQEYPETKPQVMPTSEQRFVAPTGYSDSLDHFTNFFAAMRSRKQVVEDAVFGFRAAGPALLTNQSYFESRVYGWNPEAMRVTGEVAKS